MRLRRYLTPRNKLLLRLVSCFVLFKPRSGVSDYTFQRRLWYITARCFNLLSFAELRVLPIAPSKLRGTYVVKKTISRTNDTSVCILGNLVSTEAATTS